MKYISLYSMAILYIAAGINHFRRPKMYKKIMPPYIPWHLPLVYASGIAEIVLGVLLIPEATRPVAAWLIIALLIAIFPANIQMAINYYRRHHPYTWLTILRLPVQILLIVWAWQFTKQG